MATVLSTLFESKGNVTKTEAQSEEAGIRVEKTSVAEQHTLRKRNGFLMQTKIYSIWTRKQGKKRTLRVTYLLSSRIKSR
jgi:hypothetical protein